jgi:hypothetical protein
MPSERDLIRQTATRQKPKSLKRAAPKPEISSEEKRKRGRRYGIPTTVRLEPDTRAAIEQAAELHNVNKRALHEFLLRAGLQLMARGHVDLPVEQAQATEIKLPPVPEEYL